MITPETQAEVLNPKEPTPEEANSKIELDTTKKTLMRMIIATREAEMAAETKAEKTALMMLEATVLTQPTATPKSQKETQHLIETSREILRGITSQRERT